MHKLVFVLTKGENAQDAKDEADSYITENLIEHGYDWHQGIKDSKRWPDAEKWDKPLDARMNIHVLEKYIDLTQEEIKEWIKTGSEELKKKGYEKELGWTMCSFSIASGTTVCWVFDNTGWSNEAIRDKDELRKALNQTEDKIWMVGFDAHH